MPAMAVLRRSAKGTTNMTNLTKSISSMRDLLALELQELYSLEQQLVEALPQMVQSASSEALREDFQEYLATTKRQRQRLDTIFAMLDLPSEAHAVKSFGAMLQEAERLLRTIENPDLRDAALISAAQKAEHLAIAAYGSARAHALEADLEEVAELLQQTLDEHGEADAVLTGVAEGDVNVRAAHW